MITEYYAQRLAEGKKYELFIKEQLKEKLNIDINILNDMYQNSGETIEGYEIKFDDRMKETGNIYIEYAEKRSSKNANYIESGILKNDNTIFFVIGNYSEFFIIDKEVLVKLYKEKDRNIRFVQIDTSRGFLISKQFASTITPYHIKIEDNNLSKFF